MNIQWCVCDLDGTLLDSRGRLSEQNRLAVHDLAERGIEVILATGRSDLFVREIAANLQIRQPVISCNGGLIRDLASGQVFFSRPIGEKMTRRLATYCLETQRDALVYSPQKIYYFRGSRKIGSYRHYNSEVAAAFRIPLGEVSHPEDLPLPEVLKFYIANINPEMAAAIQQELKIGNELSMVQSMRDALDIMAKGVSKGQALKFLARRIGFDLTRTAVFGDNHNDISMLEVAGLPIAMGNAEASVKQVARFVAPANDDSGVAHAIRHLLSDGQEE